MSCRQPATPPHKQPWSPLLITVARGSRNLTLHHASEPASAASVQSLGLVCGSWSRPLCSDLPAFIVCRCRTSSVSMQQVIGLLPGVLYRRGRIPSDRQMPVNVHLVARARLARQNRRAGSRAGAPITRRSSCGRPPCFIIIY